MSEKRSLGYYLQGVQHFGITVGDMAKAMEFYTEVLGGKVAIAGDGFYGEIIQNTCFQKDYLDAIAKGVHPKTVGVPNIQSGEEEVLDVRFVSFGNTVVELIHFRDAKLTPNAPNFCGTGPSGVGYVNAPHLSFHVKDDVDLNQFAIELEQECKRRGINLVCNRIITVHSEEERQNVDPKYNANKFWRDDDYFIEGYSDLDFGDFYGWSLFYAKGPNGEQLEFNQVTRGAKERFINAQKLYNEQNGTNYKWPLDSVPSADMG
jgi:catechol 2,3-dioxygenase-like lactoylglutathione lyase family enzyme